ncbi:MAG: hypothetical protein MK207_08215 [Saprospiraceae bacterium]|nr:hypothetical protein [Saprospiraceae bacterium]
MSKHGILNNIINFIINNYSQRRLWIMFFGTIAFMVVFATIGFYIGVGQPINNSEVTKKILDVMFNASEEQMYEQIVAYGDHGRNLCLYATLIADTFFPMVFGSFFSFFLVWLYKDSKYKIVILTPLLVVLFDYAENLQIALLLINFPERLSLVAYTCNICTSIKWVLLGFVLLFICLGFNVKKKRSY